LEAPFARYLREEERSAEIFVARTRWVVLLLLLPIPVLTIGAVAPEERAQNVLFIGLLLIGTAYGAGMEVLVRRRYRSSLRYVTSAIDFALVTAGVLGAALTLGNIADGTKTAAPVLYFLLIALAGVRLDPRLPLIVGVGAGSVILALLGVAVAITPDRVQLTRFVDWRDDSVSVARVIIVVAVLIGTAVLTAQAARAARRTLDRSLHTVTFLYSDLRGFSEFVERRGDAAAATLVRSYRELVRSALARAGGREMKTEGDSFLAQFRTSQQALACAREILREAERRGAAQPDLPMRIGVGIHAGEPVREENDYIGSAVNIAARLGQVAVAGELLVSDTVRGLLRTSGLPDMNERMGMALKGIGDPPRIFAVDWRNA
jgi:class 3 adenylate cyclase